jgi:coenzyme Q-binding protein COQ10
MPTHTEIQLSPYTQQQLFDMVADVEHYPEFLPWCRAARVLERKDGEMLAELMISFAHMTERYTSRVKLARPIQPGDIGAIDVELVSGPFEHLTNRWIFKPLENGGTRIEFFLDFKFHSRLLEKMIGGLFEKATMKMVGAFDARAKALYGKAF